jgi:hypothetical protein
MEQKETCNWKIYRTRFLVRARQLTASISIIDASGREQFGGKGDYLVICSDGSKRIAPREIFEDVYVEMESSPSQLSASIDLPPEISDQNESPCSSRFGAVANAPS